MSRLPHWLASRAEPSKIAPRIWYALLSLAAGLLALGDEGTRALDVWVIMTLAAWCARQHGKEWHL